MSQHPPGPRWWAIAAGAALLGVLSGLLVAHLALPPTSRPATAATGAFQPEHGPAPALSVANLRAPAGRLTVAEFRGQPLILNFWASWCAPCRGEMPALQRAARVLGGRVAFLGVDTSDQRLPALAFLRQTGVGYPVGFDPAATGAAAYGVYGMPTTYFVSAAGRLLGRQVGGLTEARLLALARRLFGEG